MVEEVVEDGVGLGDHEGALDGHHWRLDEVRPKHNRQVVQLVHHQKTSNIQQRKRAGQGRAGQGRAGQGRAGQGRAGQGRAGQGRAGQGRAGQGRAGQGRAGQGRAGQGRANNREGRAGQGRAGQGRAGQEGEGRKKIHSSCSPQHAVLRSARKCRQKLVLHSLAWGAS